MKNAARRMLLGLSIETEIRMARPTPAKIDWRTAKWNGSEMSRREAAAGLEPNESRTPRPTSAKVAPSSRRSTVHHQSPARDRSVRENAWVERVSSGGAAAVILRAPPAPP